VRGLFRALRGAYGILGEGKPDLRCNLLAPGFILTPMTQEFAPYLIKLGVKFALPKDVANVVLRMASDEKVIGEFARFACVVQYRSVMV
jgi:5'-hydroxyaverantin dehydrogenase